MKPRFFLADPSLVCYAGHCYDYLASLVPACAAMGYEPVVLGNRGADPDLRALGVRPVFTHWCDARYGEPRHTRHVHETALRDELAQVVSEFGVGPADVFLINTLRHWPLRGVADWLDALDPAARPAVVLVLHFTAYPNPEHSDGTVDLYREAFDRIAASPARNRILLLADAEELVEEYSGVAPGLDFHLAPVPHVCPPRPARREHGRCRIGYPGEARINKGFHLLPYVVRRVEAEGLDREVEFHVHSFCHHPTADFLRRALAGLRHPSVTLYPDQMDAEKYQEFVTSLDIVALPYLLDNYHAQTSGVFVEAMANGSLVVVPRGSWMARQLARYGGGESFCPGDAEEFARATVRLIRDRHRHAADSAGRAARWREFHSPGRFMGLVEGFVRRRAA